MTLIIKNTLLACAYLLVFVIAIFPFYYAVVTSLRSGAELFSTNPLPSAFNLINYQLVMSDFNFWRAMLNSGTVATLVVLASLLLAVTASFALARISFRGRGLILMAVLMVSMFPQIAVLSGVYQILQALGLFGTIPGLGLSYMIFTLPFTVWVLTSFMRQLPVELEEAAYVDGAGPITVIFRIFMPLIAPALVTTGLLAFIGAWNEFLFALTFTVFSPGSRTVPVAIAMIGGVNDYELPWGTIMAASVIVTIPLIVLVLIFQNRIVSGLTAGAVKG
jgi:trehalose/maltose transport system permease protein